MAKPKRESPPPIQTSAAPRTSSAPETPSTPQPPLTPQPPVRGQDALYYGAGRFRELLLFRTNATPATVLDKAAQLLKSIEMGLSEKPLKILVAVAAGYLDHLPRRAFKDEVVKAFPDDGLAVLVQVAAETEDERTYAKRFVKRIFGGDLKLAFEYCGGLHLLNREPFGFPDSTPVGDPVIPLSDAGDAEGATWLLYQNYRQDVEGFFNLPADEQVAIMGRPREAVSSDQLKALAFDASSHLKASRNGAEPGRTPLLRRSISYERYDEAGLNFLAVAKHPQKLREALERFEKADRLRKHVEPKEGGLFFVPPTANWLKANANAPSPLANAPETPFYPRFPLVLYELTPKANEFFHRVFHVNNRNLDEDVTDAATNASKKTLRSDIKLLSRGLTKLIYGGRLAPSTQIYRLLDLTLYADVSRELEESAKSLWGSELGELRQAVADVKKGELERALPEESRTSKPLSDLLGAVDLKRKALLDRVSEDPALGSILSRRGLPETLAPLLAEVVVSDAETMGELTADTKTEIDEIAKLCEEAGEEARALNEFVGEYMTFPC